MSIYANRVKPNDPNRYSVIQQVEYADSGNLDGFGRLLVTIPQSEFDSQFTYNLNPLLYDQVVSGTGASVAHDATNRAALLTFTATPSGNAYLQSFEWFRYQPGNAQRIFVTFNFRSHAAGVTKFAGYGDASNNGIHFISNGTGFAWRILSNTTLGDETVLQANWNLDKLDGTGLSGITLDVTKTQIAAIDLQALYVGRVRVGFDIDGAVIWCHEFNHANRAAYPYLQMASLPIICGMSTATEASTTMLFICATVKSEGGSDDLSGYSFRAISTNSAGNDTPAHILSLRPKTQFNSLENRIKFQMDSIDILVTGNSPVMWDLCLGQAISGTTTFSDINATYSGFEYNTAGTISGSPAIIIASGTVAATASAKSSIARQIITRYPITLSAAGAARSLGTLTLNATGLGAASAMRAVVNFTEIR